MTCQMTANEKKKYTYIYIYNCLNKCKMFDVKRRENRMK